MFEFVDPLPELDRPVLVQALDGFVDAGSATRLVREHLLATLPAEVVGRFDIDLLLDYRGRRPEMLFVVDHWESYTAPQLALYAMRDANGKPFLLLAGPEPDVQWERFVDAVRTIVARLDVSLVIGLNAIPMGVPHTRPIGVISHGNRPDLLTERANWIGTVQVPASAGHLLEFRLGQAGLDAVGFAVNVPHYLAHLDYPAAASTLIGAIARAGDLVLPTEALDEAGRVARAQVDEQVAASEQVAAVVHALERQYDEIIAGRGPSLVADGTRLPTADELGAEFEQYLSQQPGPETDTP